MSLRAEAGQTLREAPGGGGPWATALGTRSPARFEDEAGAGRGGHAAHSAVVERDEAAIEELADVDANPGIRPSAAELHPAFAKGDGVVVGDEARVAAAQDEGEVLGRAAPDRLRGGRGPGEAAIEVGDEGGQVGVRGGDGGDAAEAQFADEPILQRGPQPLDAALGLGRAGGDVADAEVLQDAAEVGRPLRAGELFLERPVGVVADEEVEAVAVEGERQAVLGEELVEQGGVAMDVFGGAEVQGEDLRGRIVDGAEEHEGRRRGAEPGEGAAVDLHEAAAGGFGGAPAPGPGRAPRPLGWAPEGATESADGLATHPEAMLLIELLRQVSIVETDVDGGHQADDL